MGPWRRQVKYGNLLEIYMFSGFFFLFVCFFFELFS